MMRKLAIQNGRIQFLLGGGLLQNVTIKNGVIFKSPNVKREGIRTATYLRRSNHMIWCQDLQLDGVWTMREYVVMSERKRYVRRMFSTVVLMSDLVHNTTYRGLKVSRVRVDTLQNTYSNQRFLPQIGLTIGGG